jgi:PAS domain S-box-containing protein
LALFLPDPDLPAAREFRYVDLVHDTPDAIYIFPEGVVPDASARPIWCNEAGVRLLAGAGLGADPESGPDPDAPPHPLREALLETLAAVYRTGQLAESVVTWQDRWRVRRRTRIRARLWQGHLILRAVDESAQWAVERGAARRERLLLGVAEAAQALLSGPLHDTFDEVAGILGEATGVSRVYLFQRKAEPPDSLVMSQTHEWCAPGIGSELHNPALQAMDMGQVGAGEVARSLQAGESVALRASEVRDPALITLLESQGILAALALPIFVEGRWWGYVGMDDCEEARHWTEGEMQVLQASALLVGTAAERDLRLRELRGSRGRLAAAVHEGQDGFLVVTPGGEVLESNPAAQEILGYGEGPVSRSLREHLPGLLDFPEPLAEASRGHEVQGLKADGGAFDAEVSLSPLHVDETPLLAVTLRDVTGKKLVESQLRQAQRLDSVGRLAGGMAHDFNNLLTVIRGNVELALMDAKEGGASRDALLEIGDAASRGARLIQQLLAFARRQVVRPEPLELNGIVRGMTRLVGTLLGDHIEVETALDPGLPRVLADPGQVEQVLMNLVLNARDAMATGGELRIETRAESLGPGLPPGSPPALVELAGHAPGPWVVLSVTDTGEGIPPELRAQVFEPFFTTKPQGQGTGLGLSTVYGIVKQSGGEVLLEPAPGQGTTVRIYLPSAEATLPLPD